MRFVAGVLIALGLLASMGATFDYLETRPYIGGETATAEVIHNVKDGTYYHAAVAFTTAEGELVGGELVSEGWIAPGTQLTISYRPNDPGEVRSPELRKISLADYVLYLGMFFGGIVLYRNPWTADRNRPKLNGETIREPEVLLAEVKQYADPEFAETIEAAFPVIERRSPINSSLPVILAVGALVVGLAASLGAAVVMTILIPLGLPAAVLFSQRSQRRGVVAVTSNKFVLLVGNDGHLSGGRVLAHVPRWTPLPSVSEYKGQVRGGPLPFATKTGAQNWHYAGDSMGRGMSFIDLIEHLAADAEYRAPQDAEMPQDAEPPQDGVPLVVPAMPVAQNAASRATYVNDVSSLAALVQDQIESALPLRSKRSRPPLIQALIGSPARRSMLVGADKYVVAQHGTFFRKQKVLSSFDRRTTTFDQALETSGSRVDASMQWVTELADELASADEPSQDYVYR